ncbi:hypothetical protein [Actinoplanes couchii]|uniref:Histidine kinase/HSP90-like ATPase domain-containing protein n=1 Tax=Actinoplanes couchii TaxID=403638 RepID=A0ABQ3XTT7_9ACTN|nr:hypothetical protein [Actinoplanes couchii]MDR6324125.1 hypothetical protein [Actinoplanes couchii]GID61860.1 hypothetical protein Aco03nite_102640 [Actinoplanes couchii]
MPPENPSAGDSITTRPPQPHHDGPQDTLTCWQLPSPLLADALLAITEVVQNVTQHTGAGGEGTLIYQAGTILVEVCGASPSRPQPC